MLASSEDISPHIVIGDTGLLLGAGTRLASRSGDGSAALDPERLEGLLSVAFRRAPSVRDLSAIESAVTHWHRGDKALANLRLVFAGLPRLDEPEDMVRLKAAEMLFDAGLCVEHLPQLFADPPPETFGKDFDPNQPRVPKNNPGGGQWTNLWARFSAWLDEEVPEYDHDTGDQVGTRSRARAIAINPLTWIAAAGAIFAGGEVVAALAPGAAAVSVEAPAAALPAAEEIEALTPFAQRYLSTSGGRLGGTQTRQQLYEMAQECKASGQYVRIQGDGHGPEEFLRDTATGRGTFVDLTAKAADGSTVRFQTIDTLADGVTPTAREMAAAARIRTLRPSDKLILVPKR